MRNFTKRHLLSVSALVIVPALVNPALAQDADSSGGAPTASAADIIVTARRVEERIQDVPISITVFNQEQLSNRNVLNAGDLAAATPSLQVNPFFGNDNTTFSIRGFVQDIGTAPTVGVYFADVVAPRGGSIGYPSGDGAGAGSFFDLQNVQVLKGPQGTLQGRNTTGGAVLLVPKKPTDELEGYLEGAVGNYNSWGIQGVVNLPLGSVARLRVGVDRQSRDGYLHNRSGIGPKDFNDVNYTAVRAGLVVDVTPNLENYTIGTFSNSDTHGTLGRLTAAYLPGELGPFAFDQLTAQRGFGFYDVLQDLPDARSRTRQWQIINTTTWSANDTLTIKNIVSYAQLKQRSNQTLFSTAFVTNVNNLEGYLSANTGVSNVGLSVRGLLQQVGTGFGVGDLFANQLDAALAPLAGRRFNFAVTHDAPGLPGSSQSTFTEELQIQGRSSDNRLTYQSGIYVELSRPLGAAGVQTPTEAACTGLGTTNINCDNVLFAAGNNYNAIASGINAFIPGTANDLPLATPRGGYNFQVNKTKFTDIGLYAQATFALTPRLKLTGGFRYTWDKQEVTGTDYFASVSGTTFCIADLSILTATNNCSVSLQQKSHAPTWLLGVDFKPNENMLIYAKYARGYRTGGVKADAPNGFNTFSPEKVDNYEVGFKSSFRGVIDGIFDADFFYNKFSNQQVQLGLSSLIGLPGQSAPMNVGRSRLWGFEANTSLNLFEGFTLSGSYTYLNTKVLDIRPFNGCGSFFGFQLYCISGQPAGIAVFTAEVGQPIAYSPKNKFSVTGSYTLPVDRKAGEITFSATFTHSDSQRTTFGYDTLLANGGTYYVEGPGGPVASRRNLGILAPTNLLDLALNWKSVGGSPVNLTAFATNVTNQKYISQASGLIALGAETTPLGPPRMYGMRARLNF